MEIDLRRFVDHFHDSFLLKAQHDVDFGAF